MSLRPERFLNSKTVEEVPTSRHTACSRCYRTCSQRGDKGCRGWGSRTSKKGEGDTEKEAKETKSDKKGRRILEKRVPDSGDLRCEQHQRKTSDQTLARVLRTSDTKIRTKSNIIIKVGKQRGAMGQ